MIGVLALQGGYRVHVRALTELGHKTLEVRTAEDFSAIDGLVLPGGESTTMLTLLERFGLEEALDAFVKSGKPILATCAGLILAAKQVTNPDQKSFGWLDVAVARNAWGRQLDSFEDRSDDGGLPLMFIRAPRITAVGSGVEVLATLRGEPVLVRQGSITGATFHPELLGDRQVHREAFKEYRT